MKKMSKLVMAAILAVALQGTAMAVVNLDDGTGVVTYANELLSVPSDAVIAGPTNQLDAEVKLGFGVSATQTRYVRFDLEGVKFQTNPKPGNGTDPDTTLLIPTTPVSQTQVTISSLTPTYVIFQITPSQNLSYDQLLTFNLADLTVTSTAGPAKITYSLYEDGPSANAGGSDNRLAGGVKKDYIKFDKGFSFTVTPNTQTALVDGGFVLFKNGLNSGTTVPIGTINYMVNANVYDQEGGTCDLDDFVIDPTKLVLTTSAGLTSADALFLGHPVTGCASSVLTSDLPLGATTATFPVNTTPYTNTPICYTATGTDEIAIQTFSIATDITPKSGASTTDVSYDNAGKFIHDGTVLRAPFYQAQAGMPQNSFVQLANMGDKDADYTLTCFSATGEKQTGNPDKVLAGKTKKIHMSATGCDSKNTNALEFVLNVEKGNVVGTFIRQNITTGDTGSDSLTGNLAEKPETIIISTP